jgi:hypothetical protein
MQLLKKWKKKKAQKKGYCETPSLKFLFSTLFDSHFSLPAAWVLLLFLQGHVQKGLWWIFLDFIVHYVPNMKKGAKREQKGHKKGDKKANCEQP